MRCSNIGPRGARNWFSVLDSPRQLLSPSSRGTRCSAECNGSKLAPAATVAPLRLGARSAPPAQLPMLSLFLQQCYFADPGGIAWPIILALGSSVLYNKHSMKGPGATT